MATVVWQGSAPAVAQVTDYLFAGTWESSDTITATIGTKAVTFTAGSTTITAIIDAIVAAWNLLSTTTHQEFAEITASRTSSTLRLTMDTAGKPFACTLTTADSGGAADAQTIDGTTSSAGTNSTANSGPNSWDTAANWSTGAVPVDSDDVYIENSSVDILYGLSQTGIDLTSLNIALTYTGRLGLPDYNTDGTPYAEYRTRYLMLGTATTLNVGRGNGTGSGRLKIHTGSNACTANVEGTGASADSSLPALLLQGSHASNVLNVTRGSVGLAVGVSTTAQFPVVRVGSKQSVGNDVTLVCGAGCTLGAITQAGGNVTVQTNVTTWTRTAGSTSVALASAAITTITQDGQGTHSHQSVGTIGTATFRGQNAILDCSQDVRARTITNATFTGGGSILDPNKTVTFTNPFATDKVSLGKHNLGDAPFSLQRS